mgnify:CR=1 FL=1
MEDLLEIIKTSNDPEIQEAMVSARVRDVKYGDRVQSALNYEWVARVASRVTGQHFTKGVRLKAGRILAEQAFSGRSK